MTNGEKIKEIFPSMPINVSEDTVYCGKSKAYIGEFSKDWWNAEYQEPTTKNNLGVDLISRADAIQAIQDKAKKLTNEDTINGLCGAVAILFDMPSVTPQEPKRGHWTYNRANVKCSCCGKGYKDFYGKANIASYNYCPNCGAKMIEPQESEDT